ncbi:MAG: hypothetical protein V2I39_10870 [Erythrobacter sp.]|jgi:hypothetical protein|nr:hypothetical protein [Erythrobacter sp.]
MRPISAILASTAIICAAPLAAQAIQQGTYVNDDDSARWIFGSGTGQFIQTQSINGNPGRIIIEFEYSVSGGTLKYRQTRISLVDHPAARSKALDESFSEPIEIRPGAIVIGGKIYRRQ